MNVGKTEIGLFNISNELYVIKSVCPHRGASLVLDYSCVRFFELAATTNNRTIRTSVMNSIVPPKLKLVK